MSDLLNVLGRGVGELEKLIHRPLYPITEYYWQVSPQLWRGSWPDERILAFLAVRGVKTIVNLCAERSQGVPNFQFVNIPIVDNTAPTDDQMQDFLQVVAVQATYVHCEQGRGRTGEMVAAYRVKVQGWKPVDALQEAVTFGLAMPAQRDWILKL